jgi:hypothetical protein
LLDRPGGTHYDSSDHWFQAKALIRLRLSSYLFSPTNIDR